MQVTTHVPPVVRLHRPWAGSVWTGSTPETRSARHATLREVASSIVLCSAANVVELAAAAVEAEAAIRERSPACATTEDRSPEISAVFPAAACDTAPMAIETAAAEAVASELAAAMAATVAAAVDCPVTTSSVAAKSPVSETGSAVPSRSLTSPPAPADCGNQGHVALAFA